MSVYVADVRACVCEGQRLMLGIFLYCSSLYFAKTVSLPEPGAHQLGQARGKYRAAHYT